MEKSVTYDPTGRADFTLSGSLAKYHPEGRATSGELADTMTFALQHAIEQKLPKIILDITAACGFDSPGPAYRRWLVTRWFELAKDKIQVAIVARPEHICPEKTGLLAAAELGLKARIFESDELAIQWLENTEYGPNDKVTPDPVVRSP